MRQDCSYKTVKDETAMSAKSIKKRTGSYYTPDHLASLITQDAIFMWLSEKANATIREVDTLSKLNLEIRNKLLNDVKRVTILDPAVGEGAFLLAAANWLRKIRIGLGDKDSEESCRQSIVTDCLFGVDIAEHAIASCKIQLKNWVDDGKKSKTKMNIQHGNSLVGFVAAPLEEDTPTNDNLNEFLYQMLNSRMSGRIMTSHDTTIPFHWRVEFQDVFRSETPGFDIVVGNPPYGSILGQIERQFISSVYPNNVGGGRLGTWNSAAHFLVRATSLMKDGAQLGFLVPNSFLRVKQFSKTREFLLDHTKLWKIVDEGSPFDGVTLEMVSLFCERKEMNKGHKISVESRRFGLEQSNELSSQALRESKIFPIYHDHILTKILKRGEKGLLIAGRGSDIPKEHVRKKQTSKFKTPYITSGRSVQRYGLRPKHIYYTDNWFRKKTALNDSFQNEFLVATKNYRYPRCILKPQGVIHGGGIVKITPLYNNADLRVLGLILNSRLVKHVSIRYLTNYSQLTCCLNTGIMEELPLALPKRPQVYRGLFNSLSRLYSNQEDPDSRASIPALEELADALVYSLYFGDEGLEKRVSEGVHNLSATVQEAEVEKMIEEILSSSIVRELEHLGSFPASRKLRRY